MKASRPPLASGGSQHSYHASRDAHDARNLFGKKKGAPAVGMGEFPAAGDLRTDIMYLYHAGSFGIFGANFRKPSNKR